VQKPLNLWLAKTLVGIFTDSKKQQFEVLQLQKPLNLWLAKTLVGIFTDGKKHQFEVLQLRLRFKLKRIFREKVFQ